ncbi:MAG: hypothetical protein AAGA45_02460 [Verrucomicrobiota bacterium]
MKMILLSLGLMLAAVALSADTYQWGTDVDFALGKKYLVTEEGETENYVVLANINRVTYNKNSGIVTVIAGDNTRLEIDFGSINRTTKLTELLRAIADAND